MTSIVQFLELGLDASALRQKVIANNIANLNTPGFKRSEVKFEDQLKSALGGQAGVSLQATSPNHINSQGSRPGAPTVSQVTNTSNRADGNNVDIELEQVYLAANSIKFQALTQQVSDQFSQLRYVINEGRR